MQFTRRKDRQKGSVHISGGVYLVTFSDGSEGALALHFNRPDPGSELLIASDVMAINMILTRYKRELLRYKHGLIEADKPPSLAIEKQRLQPLVDWVRQHLTRIEGLVDRVAGVKIDSDDLSRDEIDDVLFSIGVDHLIALFAVIKDSDGLDEVLAKRLDAYLEVMTIGSGCSCSWCKKGRPDSDCLIKDLRPLNDINWMLTQYEHHKNTDPGAMPGWARQIRQKCDQAGAIKAKRIADDREQAALAARFKLVG